MSFKDIHQDGLREAKLQKAEAEKERRLSSLRKMERDLESEMAKVQGLPNLSHLKDQLIAVRAEIARLGGHK